MPYALSLQTCCLPEFYSEAPEAWVKRLREISPVTENMAHLRFRYRAPQPDWNFPERGVWELYSCTPKHLMSKERAELFEKHWSEVSLEPEKPVPHAAQMARRISVSSYQHFMWHTLGVDAQRFWVLQGEGGGTPAQYTRREERLLDACNVPSEAFPLGFFPACPFDERAVKEILQRDRFIQAELRIEDLLKMDRPEALKAEDDEAEREFRKAFLDWWYVQIQPQKEFMQSTLFKTAADDLPPAPEGLERTLAQWKETFVEEGVMPDAGIARSKTLHLAVK